MGIFGAIILLTILGDQKKCSRLVGDPSSHSKLVLWWSAGRRDDKVCLLLSACFVSEYLPPPPAAIQTAGRGAIAPDLHEAVIPGHMAMGPEGTVYGYKLSQPRE